MNFYLRPQFLLSCPISIWMSINIALFNGSRGYDYFKKMIM